MKNLLFISSYPFPLYKGSNQHAHFFVKALSSMFNVYCIFFVQPENRKNFQDVVNKNEVGIKEYAVCYFKPAPKGVLSKKYDNNKYLLKLRQIFQFPYSYMNSATHEEGKQVIQHFVEKHSIDIVHVEHFHYTKYLFDLSPEIKKVVVYHDLYHRIHWDQFKINKSITAKFDSIISGLKKYIYERLLVLKTDMNIFLNPEEMKSFPKRSACIPHIVNPDIRYNWSEDSDIFNILFLGGYNHPPNRVSVAHIVNSILPLLAERLKKFRIWIIGPGAEKYEEIISASSYRDFIRLKGFVPDINDVFQGMHIALLPILYGGGIKTKVIEAMAAGLPVVTTPDGIYGLQNLPENCIDVCVSPDEFFTAVEMLQRTSSLRKKRSSKGVKFISQNHSVDMLNKRIKEVYTSIFQNKVASVE